MKNTTDSYTSTFPGHIYHQFISCISIPEMLPEAQLNELIGLVEGCSNRWDEDTEGIFNAFILYLKQLKAEECAE